MQINKSWLIKLGRNRTKLCRPNKCTHILVTDLVHVIKRFSINTGSDVSRIGFRGAGQSGSDWQGPCPHSSTPLVPVRPAHYNQHKHRKHVQRQTSGPHSKYWLYWLYWQPSHHTANLWSLPCCRGPVFFISREVHVSLWRGLPAW